VYNCFHDTIKILFSLNLYNFGCSVSFDTEFLHVGSCILFYLLLLYVVCL
jgi:hypothetical protein